MQGHHGGKEPGRKWATMRGTTQDRTEGGRSRGAAGAHVACLHRVFHRTPPSRRGGLHRGATQRATARRSEAQQPPLLGTPRNLRRCWVRPPPSRRDPSLPSESSHCRQRRGWADCGRTLPAGPDTRNTNMFTDSDRPAPCRTSSAPTEHTRVHTSHCSAQQQSTGPCVMRSSHTRTPGACRDDRLPLSERTCAMRR